MQAMNNKAQTCHAALHLCLSLKYLMTSTMESVQTSEGKLSDVCRLISVLTLSSRRTLGTVESFCGLLSRGGGLLVSAEA